jgi:molybdenum cofactor cytidylyltransferase
MSFSFRPPIALVLSAGASERWGGSPKAFLRVGESGALEHIVRTCRTAGLDEVRLVVGADAGRLTQAAHELDVDLPITENPDWAEGRTGSIQAGLRDLPPTAEVLLWPVDQPFARPATVAALIACALSDLLATWIIPEFDARGGHPVLLRPAAWREVFTLGPDQPLRDLIPRLGPQVRRLPVPDPGVVVNLNTPEEYLQAMELLRRGEVG